MPFKIDEIYAVERSVKEGRIAFLALPQSRLGPLALGDIDVRTNPLNVPVASADTPPTQAVNELYRPVGKKQAKIQFKVSFLANGPFKSLAVSWPVLRVNSFHCLFKRYGAFYVPYPIVFLRPVEDLPYGSVPNPTPHAAYLLGNGQIAFGTAQCLFRPLSLGNVL